MRLCHCLCLFKAIQHGRGKADGLAEMEHKTLVCHLLHCRLMLHDARGRTFLGGAPQGRSRAPDRHRTTTFEPQRASTNANFPQYDLNLLPSLTQLLRWHLDRRMLEHAQCSQHHKVCQKSTPEKRRRVCRESMSPHLQKAPNPCSPQTQQARNEITNISSFSTANPHPGGNRAQVGAPAGKCSTNTIAEQQQEQEAAPRRLGRACPIEYARVR
jgi:hypothetical protein